MSKELILKTTDDKEVKIDLRFEVGTDMNILPEYGIGYDRYIVTCNGFIIATFIDEASLKSYMNFLKLMVSKYGLQMFPKPIQNVIAGQSNKGDLIKIK